MNSQIFAPQKSIFKSKNILTYTMDAKLIKVTDKGQISIPSSFRNALGISKGNTLIAIVEGETIILQNLTDARFKDLVQHSQKIAQKLWSNEEDDVWDKI
jgi:AbrB family looped-hinge helix DNA binding protein